MGLRSSDTTLKVAESGEALHLNAESLVENRTEMGLAFCDGTKSSLS